MPEPYDYLRGITIGLGTLWTLGGLRRMMRFAGRWEERLEAVGLSKNWLRCQVAIFTLRATVLDPINLALFCVLVFSWSARAMFF